MVLYSCAFFMDSVGILNPDFVLFCDFCAVTLFASVGFCQEVLVLVGCVWFCRVVLGSFRWFEFEVYIFFRLLLQQFC